MQTDLLTYLRFDFGYGESSNYKLLLDLDDLFELLLFEEFSQLFPS